MVPYLHFPVLWIGGLPLYPFTYFVSLGMAVCFVLAQRRVKRVGLYAPLSAVGFFWLTVGGFLGAHLFDLVAYTPGRLLANPRSLLAIDQGLSSMGGFIGGITAFYLYCRRAGVWMLPYLDAMMFGFAPGWIIGRLACFSAHDHPGWRSSFFLAVQYPGGARHDLGLYGMLLAVVITLVIYLLPRRPRFVGFYTALVLTLYAPARFLLDFLRAEDRRYLGFTPAQYLCVVMLGLAVWLWTHRRQPGTATPTAAADKGATSAERQ